MNSLNSRWPVIGVVIAVLLVGACAPSGTQSATTQPSASSGPKVLKMARNAEPFSPFVPWQIDDNPTLFISVNVYDTLLRTTKDGVSVEPGLASKWESSADALTWTFTLRDGVKFSDGSPLKGSDVTASLDMARGGAKIVRGAAFKPRSSPYSFQGLDQRLTGTEAQAIAVRGIMA